MICSIKKKIDGEVKTFQDCFMYTTPVENEIYCSVCEGITVPERIANGYSCYKKQVININTQTERVSIRLCVCKTCAEDFARYGTD